MDMPKPSAAHQKLRALVGRYSGPETVYQSPFTQEASAVGSWAMRLGLDGFFLLLDYVQEVGGAPVMRGHGLIGVADGAYTLHWFDSFGSPPKAAARGAWDGDTLTFERDLDGGGRYRVIFALDAGSLAFRAETDNGRGYEPVVEGSYVRREPVQPEISLQP